MSRMFKFNYVQVTRIIDGDTFDVVCDTGFGGSHKARIRLLDIDAPEYRGSTDPVKALSARATQWLTQRLAPWREGIRPGLSIETHKKDGFGRYLAHACETGQPGTISQEMLDLKLVWPYKSPQQLTLLAPLEV